jgi:putative SOS response-associated peptidase YedK
MCWEIRIFKRLFGKFGVMCGRYTVVTKMEAIEKEFNAAFDLPCTPIYNGVPSHALPVITNDKPNVIQQFRWGLIPSWAKDHKIGFKTINARSEEVVTKASFRKPIRSQRCLVLANCYFEWKKEAATKTPHVIYVQDQRLFAMAGVWDEWTNTSTGELILSFSILTTAATDLLHPLHHRMPVILDRDQRQRWISNLSLNDVTGMFQQYPSDRMNAYPVGTDVNIPANNTVEILSPTGPRIQ